MTWPISDAGSNPAWEPLQNNNEKQRRFSPARAEARWREVHLALSLFARLEAFNQRIPTPPQCQIDPPRTTSWIFSRSSNAILRSASFCPTPYCGASARIKFDDEQFEALYNELMMSGNKEKLMQIFGH
jgi:hypothetical protein